MIFSDLRYYAEICYFKLCGLLKFFINTGFFKGSKWFTKDGATFMHAIVFHN